MDEELLEETLFKLDLNDIADHPETTRLVYSSDVIAAMAETLEEHGYSKHHALTVRLSPAGSEKPYQILSGHVRVRAARRAGLTHCWAWVDVYSDEEALMELVTSNMQGELTPLEIGLHCFRHVNTSKGGRGIKGGVSSYAQRVGLSCARISQLRNAAQVAITVQTEENYKDVLIVLRDKAGHLTAIHEAPEEAWSALVCTFLEMEQKGQTAWTVYSTRREVSTIKSILASVPRKWIDCFIPVRRIVETVVKGGLEPAYFSSLVSAVSVVESHLEVNKQHFPDEPAAFHDWLRNHPEESWNQQAVLAYWSRKSSRLVEPSSDKFDIIAGFYDRLPLFQVDDISTSALALLFAVARELDDAIKCMLDEGFELIDVQTIKLQEGINSQFLKGGSLFVLWFVKDSFPWPEESAKYTSVLEADHPDDVPALVQSMVKKLYPKFRYGCINMDGGIDHVKLESV